MRIALVLGGGGMRGLAHVGVLRALLRRGLTPDEYIGTSAGAYVAALAAGGLSPDEIRDIALSIRRQDLLDYDWLGLLWKRGRARSLYRGKALHDFIRRTLPCDRFADLPHPLYMTAIDLGGAGEVVWGMPGFRDIPIHDCVVASCSLPGIYPPKRIGPYSFVDGGIVDTLPIKVAVYTRADLIVAVHLDSGNLGRPVGMASILEQSQTIVSRALVDHNLRAFQGAPLIVVRPRTPLGLFDFEHPEEAIEAGERAAEAALALNPLLARIEKKAPAPPDGGAGASNAPDRITEDSSAG
ncbi:MAG TPA: patatin-like phospholipase family protein [Planctomycetota bacterium]